MLITYLVAMIKDVTGVLTAEERKGTTVSHLRLTAVQGLSDKSSITGREGLGRLRLRRVIGSSKAALRHLHNLAISVPKQVLPDERSSSKH
jgi:hypothetical protein